MRVKKIALFMVPVLVLLCCSFALAGNVVEYTYDADGNIQDAIFPPPTVQITADPATIYEGLSTTLTWSSTSATVCEIQPEVGGGLPPNGSATVSPIETTTYTITATSGGGTATDTVTVTVEPPPPPPTVTISADPATIDYGASTTLMWTSTDATACSIDQGVGNVVPPEGGSIDVSPTATTTYTITATGPVGETATDTVTVTVIPPPPPTVTISADPTSIDYGAISTLSWTATNAETVTIEPGIGIVEANGTQEVSPTLTTIYTITATGIGGIADPATDSVTITVAPPPAPTVTISADPESIPNGESATLTWNSNYATSCEIQPGVGTVDPNGSISVSPNETTAYTITATGIGGDTATDTATVTVVGCDIYLHDRIITAGSTVVRTTACTITAGPDYIIEAGATVTFQAAQGITLAPGFEAREGCEFTANCNITPPAPLASISANPESIAYGETSTLSWSSSNADTVTIDQGIGTVDPSGSTAVSPAETTTYTITATGAGGTATDSVTVTVTPLPAPTVSIGADPASIAYGESSTLSWSSSNADTVTIDQGIGTVDPSGSTAVSPAETTTYTITATGSGGTATDTVTVTVTTTPPAPTVSITADPATIEEGQSSTLTWISMDATSCDIQPDVGTVGLNGSIDVSPTVTTTYIITATGAGGTATDSVTVTVTPPPAPTVQITADPTIIQSDESTTLTWSSTDADTCDIQPDVGTVGPNGSISVSPTETTTYTITATGAGGTATDSVTVTVTSAPPAPTVSITADPASIAYGESSTLTWSSTDAASCNIQPDVGEVGLNGSIDVSPTETTTYTITATGAGGTAIDSVTVTVAPPPPPQTVNLRPNGAGDETNITDTFPSGQVHYTMVDDPVGSPDDNDTRLNETASDYKRDLFSLVDVSLSGVINWIKVWTRARSGISGGSAKTAVKTGGTVYEGDAISLSTSYSNYSTQYTTNPQTGVAWTWDDVNSLQAGVSLKGGGWLAGWGYRKPVTLSRPSGGVTDYQIKLLVGESAGASGAAVDCGGNCKTDFSDLRFTAADGTTLLSYWIESLSGSTPNQLATIWIKFDSIGTAATTFYMYYGNASAPSYSSGSDTFLFFDDFSSDTISSGVWSVVAGTWAITGGELKATLTSSESKLVTASYTLPANYCIHWKGKSSVNANASYFGIMHRYSNTTNFYHQVLYFNTYDSPSEGHMIGKCIANGWSNSISGWDWTSNTYYKQKMEVLGNAQTGYDTDEASHSLSRSDSNLSNGKVGFRSFNNSGGTHYAYFDNIFISNFVAGEPTWGSWGSEEAGGLDSDCTQVYVEVNYTPTGSSVPTVQISADPASIDYGGTSTLSWTSTNAHTVTIDQGIGEVELIDTLSVSPTETTTYTITATGPGGTVTDSVTVTVLEGDIYLHDETIAAGSTVEHTTQYSIFAGPNYIIEAGATVTLQAGQEITLNPGFEAREGCEFRAFLAP